MRTSLCRYFIVALIALNGGCKKETGTVPIGPPTIEDFFTATVSPSVIVRSIAIGQHGYLFAETPSGILKSVDSGATWESSSVMTTQGYVAADENGNVYASGFVGVYRSSNNGSSWLYSTRGLSDTSQALNPTALVVSPDGTVLVGTLSSGVFRSTDQGASWTQTPMPWRDIRSLHITRQGHVYAGCNWYQNVIFRSTDTGISWSELPSLSNQIIFALGSDSSGCLYAGGLQYLYRSSNSGSSWEPIASTSAYITSVAPISRLRIFATIAGGGVFKTEDAGSTWQRLNTGLPLPNARCAVVDKRGYLFVGTDGSGIFRSVNKVVE